MITIPTGRDLRALADGLLLDELDRARSSCTLRDVQPDAQRSQRVLGLDVGSRTIGVAVSDELGLAAHGVTTLERRGTVKDVKQVQQLCARYQTDRIVIGMPYELDGSEGHRASRVRVLLEALQAAGLQVEPWDERFTTVDAEAVLLEANVSRARRKELIDQLAAQKILQGWLDGRKDNEP